MTREQWAERIIRNYATGFSVWPEIAEARDFLAGKAPPVEWKPRDKPPLSSTEAAEVPS